MLEQQQWKTVVNPVLCLTALCRGLERKSATKQSSVSVLCLHDPEQFGISLNTKLSLKLGKSPKHNNKAQLQSLVVAAGAVQAHQVLSKMRFRPRCPLCCCLQAVHPLPHNIAAFP